MILWRCRARWRYRVAPAMAKEFFKAHSSRSNTARKAWFTNSSNYYLSALFFNAFPLPQREAGTRQTLRYIGELFAEGYSVLIFPEGKRTDDGQHRPVPGRHRHDGARLDVPVVPVGCRAWTRSCTTHGRWPSPGRRGSVSARRCACRATTTPLWRNRCEDAVAPSGTRRDG